MMQKDRRFKINKTSYNHINLIIIGSDHTLMKMRFLSTKQRLIICHVID